MVVVKNWHFFHLFILGKIWQKKVFHDNLNFSTFSTSCIYSLERCFFAPFPSLSLLFFCRNREPVHRLILSKI